MYLTARQPRETGREYALRTIRSNIIRLKLEPGSMLSENALATEMGLSRTPVREALMELARDRIVEVYPQRGSAVALVDYALVEENRFMRSALERAVIQLDCEMAVPEDLDRLRENVKLQKFYLENYYPETLMELDNAFHRILFEIAHKTQVHALMECFSIHFDRVRSMALGSVRNLKIVQDHADLADAVARRDAPAAAALMEKHLSRYKIDEQELRETYPASYFKK